MKASLKAALETAIQNSLDQMCEHDDWPDGLVHPELIQHMANAAEAVFDATFASSQYTEKETG